MLNKLGKITTVVVLVCFFISTLFLISCTSIDRTESEGVSGKDSPSSLETVSRSSEEHVPEKASSVLYNYENDTIFQKAEIMFLSENEIKFKLTTENRISGHHSIIEGVAFGNSHADPEVDEDEQGNAFPAEQYIFEKDCQLTVRIEMEQKAKLRVLEGNCDKKHYPDCPFGSIGSYTKSNSC